MKKIIVFLLLLVLVSTTIARPTVLKYITINNNSDVGLTIMCIGGYKYLITTIQTARQAVSTIQMMELSEGGTLMLPIRCKEVE